MGNPKVKQTNFNKKVEELKNKDCIPSSKNLFQLILNTKEQIYNKKPDNKSAVLQLLLSYKIGCFLFVNNSEVMRSLSHRFFSDSELIYNEEPSLVSKLEFCEDGNPNFNKDDIDFIFKKQLLTKIFNNEQAYSTIKESYAEGLVSSYSKWPLSYNSIYDEYLDDI